MAEQEYLKAKGIAKHEVAQREPFENNCHIQFGGKISTDAPVVRLARLLVPFTALVLCQQRVVLCQRLLYSSKTRRRRFT